MEACISKLISQCDERAALNAHQLPTDMDRARLLVEMENRANSMREQSRVYSELLSKHIYPILARPEEIDGDNELGLYRAAQKLSSHTYRFDSHLALRIYQALLSKARGRGDEDAVLKYAYWCGITAFYAGRFLYGDARDYFREGASHAARYYDIADAEIRRYVHRCVGNLPMMLYNLDEDEAADRADEDAMAFWNTVMFSGRDADFPWNSYFLSVLTHRHAHNIRPMRENPRGHSREVLRSIVDVAMHIHHLFNKDHSAAGNYGGTRYNYMLWEAQFFAGLISFDQLRQNIQEKAAALEEDDFSQDAMYTRILLASFITHYIGMIHAGEPHAGEMMRAQTRKAYDYFKRIPLSADPQFVASYVTMFVSNTVGALEADDLLELVLMMTSCRHIPTYAHSIMVGEIGARLAEGYYARDPDAFSGVLSGGAYAQGLEGLKRFARVAGLCHDVGKVGFIYNTALQTRDLTADDMPMVHEHPTIGRSLLRKFADAPAMSGFADVAEGHHRFYDGTDGYPEGYDPSASVCRAMVDIISVANVIDAATDGYSKTYGTVKDFEGIVGEIRAQSGTRFCPRVVALLSEADVAADIARMLDERRAEAYYEAYLHASGQDTQHTWGMRR